MAWVVVQNTFLTIESDEVTPARSCRRSRSCEVFGKSFVTVASQDLYSFEQESITAMVHSLRKFSVEHRLARLAKLKEAMMHYDDADWNGSCTTRASSECGSLQPSLDMIEPTEPSHSAVVNLPWPCPSVSCAPTKVDLHTIGQCKPCLYLHFKEDGCRQGSECPFCHVCTRAEAEAIRKNKKMDQRAARRQRTGR